MSEIKPIVTGPFIDPKSVNASFNGINLSKLGFGTFTYSEFQSPVPPFGLGEWKAEGSITLEKGAFESILKIFPKIKPIYRRIRKGSEILFEHWGSPRRVILQILSEVNLANQSEILLSGWPYEILEAITTSNTIDIPMNILCGPRYERKMKMTLAKLVRNGRVKQMKLGAKTYYSLRKKKKLQEIIRAAVLLKCAWNKWESYKAL